MEVMKKIFFFLFVSQGAWALSPEALRIFSRQNRVYAPPPKSVRANRSDSFSGLYAVTEKKKKFEDLSVQAQARDEDDVEEEAVEEPLSSETQVKKQKKKRKEGAEQNEAHGDPKKRRFGVGLVGGGAYGIFGVEFDFHIADQWSAGFGLGTGMAYDTWGAHSRFFFVEDVFSPFTQMGYANWYIRRPSQTGEKVSPQFLAQRFFEDSNGQISSNKRLHLIYGGIGVLYQSPSDIAAALQLDYFIHLKNFEGGLYGSLGLYYYF